MLGFSRAPDVKPKDNICVIDCVFTEINALKRTHESFEKKLQEQHHLTNTTMTKLINIGTKFRYYSNIFFGSGADPEGGRLGRN